ncbi:hypothetical protein [Streptomyces bobili]|uniref:hypothetical protein n=1 Tax=Streptomyces bobili TaxID=67280 RepID=UPI0037FE1A02
MIFVNEERITFQSEAASIPIAECSFFLEKNPNGIRLLVTNPSLDAVQLVFARLTNSKTSPMVRALFELKGDFIVPHLSAVHSSRADPYPEAVSAWNKFCKQPLGDDFYVFTASFCELGMAIPRPICVHLMKALCALNEAHRMDSKYTLGKEMQTDPDVE